MNFILWNHTPEDAVKPFRECFVPLNHPPFPSYPSPTSSSSLLHISLFPSSFPGQMRRGLIQPSLPARPGVARVGLGDLDLFSLCLENLPLLIATLHTSYSHIFLWWNGLPPHTSVSLLCKCTCDTHQLFMKQSLKAVS